MASRVYPSLLQSLVKEYPRTRTLETHPGGTEGSVRVRVPAELLTGLAIAKLLLKTVFARNNDQSVGSPGAGVQVMVAVLALRKLVGVLNVRALATEDKRATVLWF